MNYTINNTAMTALEKCRKALPDASSVKSFLGRYKKILRIALAAVLLLAVLGSCFGGGYKRTVEDYVVSIATQDGEGLMDLMPKSLVKAILKENGDFQDRKDMARFLAQYGAETFGYGKVTDLTLEIEEIKPVSDRELEKIRRSVEEMKEDMGLRLKVTDAKTAQVMVHFESGYFGQRTTVVYVTLYKIGGDWYWLPL